MDAQALVLMDAREGALWLMAAVPGDVVPVPRSTLEQLVTRLSELEERAAVAVADPDALLSLTEAAAECGYSADYLGRLVKRRQLVSHGTKFRPRVRRGDLPRKATALPAAQRSA